MRAVRAGTDARQTPLPDAFAHLAELYPTLRALETDPQISKPKALTRAARELEKNPSELKTRMAPDSDGAREVRSVLEVYGGLSRACRRRLTERASSQGDW